SNVLAGFELLAVFVPDNGVNPKCARTGAAGLHAIKSRLCGAEKAAGFGLPPGVYNRGFVFANDFVIPTPDFGLDWLADGGHVFKGIVIFFRLIGTSFAEHSNGSGRSVEDVDAEAFGDAPGASGVGELRDTFVKNAGRSQSERAVDNVGMAGDPADVGHTPV